MRRSIDLGALETYGVELPDDWLTEEVRVKLEKDNTAVFSTGEVRAFLCARRSPARPGLPHPSSLSQRGAWNFKRRVKGGFLEIEVPLDEDEDEDEGSFVAYRCKVSSGRFYPTALRFGEGEVFLRGSMGDLPWKKRKVGRFGLRIKNFKPGVDPSMSR